MTQQDDASAVVPIDIRSVALTILAVVAGVVFLHYAQALIIPIVLAVLISYALDPVVSAMARIRIPRAIASALVLLTLVGTIGTVIYGLRFEADAIVQQLPAAATRARRLLDQGPGQKTAIGQVQKAASEIEKAVDASGPSPRPGVTRVQVEPASIRVGDYLMSSFPSIAGALAQGVLVLFLTLFLLSSGDLYKRKLVKIVGPSLSKKKITLQILADIDRQIGRFLLVQLATSTIVGVVTWLAFRWLGLEQAGVWGLFAGVFNSIPYFGPVIVTGGTMLVAFLQFGTVGMALAAGGIALVITSLEGFLLTPWLTSRAARMNAVAVFVGLLFWGWVWSLWGLLLAVPLLMALKAICDHVEDFKGIGELLSE